MAEVGANWWSCDLRLLGFAVADAGGGGGGGCGVADVADAGEYADVAVVGHKMMEMMSNMISLNDVAAFASGRDDVAACGNR